MKINPWFDDGTKLSDYPDLVLFGEAAKIARCSPSTFGRYVEQGAIVPARQLSSGVKLYRRTDCDQLAVALRRHRPEPPATEDDTGYIGISVHQPFASQIADGTKRFEARSWQISPKRLPMKLVICSSARLPSKEFRHLPTGVTIAYVTVRSCIPFREGEGGFAWLLTDVIPLPPVPVKGRQGLFKLSDLTLKRRPRPAGAVGRESQAQAQAQAQVNAPETEGRGTR